MKLPLQVGTVVTFVSGQAAWALARSALRSRHLDPIYNFKPYGDFGYIGGGNHESQGQPITFPHQVYGAPFTFPTVGNIFTPFLPGTKLPSRKVSFQSNLAWASKGLRILAGCLPKLPGLATPGAVGGKWTGCHT